MHFSANEMVIAACKNVSEAHRKLGGERTPFVMSNKTSVEILNVIGS